MQAIHQVYRGEASLHPKIAGCCYRKLRRHSPHKIWNISHTFQGNPPTVDPLTERELEVLKLVAHGRSNREIADQLIVTEGTVRTHVSNILDKLHLASRTQATLYALREGLASLDDVDEGF